MAVHLKTGQKHHAVTLIFALINGLAGRFCQLAVDCVFYTFEGCSQQHPATNLDAFQPQDT